MIPWRYSTSGTNSIEEGHVDQHINIWGWQTFPTRAWSKLQYSLLFGHSFPEGVYLSEKVKGTHARREIKAYSVLPSSPPTYSPFRSEELSGIKPRTWVGEFDVGIYCNGLYGSWLLITWFSLPYKKKFHLLPWSSSSPDLVSPSSSSVHSNLCHNSFQFFFSISPWHHLCSKFSLRKEHKKTCFSLFFNCHSRCFLSGFLPLWSVLALATIILCRSSVSV